MSTIAKNLMNKNSDPLDIVIKLSIEELEEVVTLAADKYYNTSKPILSDPIYDMLIDFLRVKNPKSKVLKTVGATLKSKNKVKLDYWLGSMDKIKPPSNLLQSWQKSNKGPYNFSDKLDGISALLTYNNNTIKMFTRGTADEGMDISSLLKYLKSIPSFETVESYCNKNKLKGNKNLIAFRGELIMKESVFKKNWSDKLKNARNTVAGLVNSKKINPELASDVDLVLYEVVDPFYTIDMQFKIINDLKFNCVINKTVNKELTFESMSKYLIERRDKSNYMVDGIIITDMKNTNRNVDGNPEYAFAFKDVLDDQKGITTVLDIEWNVSKNGYLNPTLILKPIEIGGVEIKRATGFNAKFIVDNILGPGAEIEIIRSGDVIPYVKTILKPAKSGNPYLPNMAFHWNETKVDIQLDNMNNNIDVLVKNIFFFFSSLDTRGLGEKNIEKMVASGLDSIQKILSCTEKDLLKVDGFKEKTATNIVESIKKAMTDISLARLMAASNRLGEGLGEERFKTVLAKYPDIMEIYKDWTKKEFTQNIMNINGWGEETTTLFVNNMSEFIKFYKSIKKYITLKELKKATKEISGKFSNKTLVLTGFRDKELQEKIEEQGGKIGSAVSKNTDYVVVKDQSVIDDLTEKIKKAQELGITIITKEKLLKLL